MEKLASGVIICAAVIGIIAGGVYLSKNVSYGCVDFWPLSNSKACGITTR